jgi:hypothetical protein
LGILLTDQVLAAGGAAVRSGRHDTPGAMSLRTFSINVSLDACVDHREGVR